jgi:hypothetical protein
LESKLFQKEEEFERVLEEKKDWNSRAVKLDNDYKYASNQLEYFEKSYNEMGVRKSDQIEMLSKELNSQNFKEKELISKLHAMEREIDDYKDENRRLKKDLDLTKADCENIVKIMEENE